MEGRVVDVLGWKVTEALEGRKLSAVGQSIDVSLGWMSRGWKEERLTLRGVMGSKAGLDGK